MEVLCTQAMEGRRGKGRSAELDSDQRRRRVRFTAQAAALTKAGQTPEPAVHAIAAERLAVSAVAAEALAIGAVACRHDSAAVGRSAS